MSARFVAVLRGAAAPEIAQREGVYVGYFENVYGEQLVYVRDERSGVATLYHSDVDWEPRRVTRGGFVDLVMHDAELLWLRACHLATQPRVDHHRRQRAEAKRQI